jgi:hypothetical protein
MHLADVRILQGFSSLSQQEHPMSLEMSDRNSFQRISFNICSSELYFRSGTMVDMKFEPSTFVDLHAWQEFPFSLSYSVTSFAYTKQYLLDPLSQSV